jgi:hypothetical protein
VFEVEVVADEAISIANIGVYPYERSADVLWEVGCVNTPLPVAASMVELNLLVPVPTPVW